MQPRRYRTRFRIDARHVRSDGVAEIDVGLVTVRRGQWSKDIDTIVDRTFEVGSGRYVAEIIIREETSDDLRLPFAGTGPGA